jgi:hypothetical protein
MAATDNLSSLHKHEEELRAQSLETIKADAALSDHWNLVAEAMNAIYAFTHDHVHESQNELTLQYLGIRLFNAAGASVKLALPGYYQKAFHQVRDVIETSFLVDYLSTYPEKIDEWRRADKKMRVAQFGPGFTLEDPFRGYVPMFPCKLVPGQGWINSWLETPLPPDPVDWRCWDELSIHF